MLVRIFEYATQIALDESEIVKNVLEVTIPNSVILFLRSNKSTPDKMQIVINTPGGSVAFDVLVMKVRKYNLEDIFEKNLLFLIPFYIFNYSSKQQLDELNTDENKLNILISKYKQIVEHLDTLTEQGKLSAYNRSTILEMANKVVKSLMSSYEKAMKGVESVMGGTVLEYKAKTIYREGRAEGNAEGREKGLAEGLARGEAKGIVETLAASIKALIETGQYNFDSAFNLIKAPTDKYNQIKELVLG